MTLASTPDLSDALSAARRPLQRRRSAPASLRERVKTTPWARRLLPQRIAVARAEARGRAFWEQAKKRQKALTTMEAILAGTPRAGELEALARQHLIEAEVREELFWRPWVPSIYDPTSAQRLRQTLDSARGVLISPCHVSAFFLSMGEVIALGHTPYAVAAPWLFESAEDGAWDRRLDRWWSGVRSRDERLVSSVRSFPVLQALLEQGEVVQLFFDMPGGHETRFLGKPVMLATGSARLAFAAGVPILPICARRERHRIHTDVAEPLHPSEFDSAEDLHEALAAVHERWILEAPATLEDPRRPGAWELGANPSGWSRPER